MNKLGITSFIAVISVTICIVCIIYINSVSDKAEVYINEIQSCVVKNENKQALKEALSLKKFWESNHGILSTILHHEMLEEIEESIEVIEYSLQHQDEKNIDFWLETARSLSKIKNLKHSEIPSLANIL